MKDTDLANAAPAVALILAAGLGSRLLLQIKTPKPLFTLGVVALVMNVEVIRRIVVCSHADENR